MWTVSAGSRLHFGLIHVGGDDAARRFGGVGLMVEEPALSLRAEPAAAWSAEGPLAARALAFARRFSTSVADKPRPPRRLVIESAAPEHLGLGSGTQLALATAAALASSWGLSLPAAELAGRAGRGERSALGTHGFAHGGLLVEAGKRRDGELSPLVARYDFPACWPVVVILPDSPAGLHGGAERGAFQGLATPPATRDALCRLVLLGLLPALLEGDVAAFGEAVHELNARAGEVFAAAQGGTYAPAAAAWVAYLRRLGVAGCGQSSWGPGVFAVAGDEEQARWLAGRARAADAPPAAAVVVTRARNRGADRPG